jgi:hypothetical protein
MRVDELVLFHADPISGPTGALVSQNPKLPTATHLPTTIAIAYYNRN